MKYRDEGAPPSGCEGGSWGFRIFLSHIGIRDAHGIETLLRPGGSAFRHVQLLSAAAFLGNQLRTNSFCARTRTRSPRIRFLAFGLRGHAGARAPAHRGAAERNAFDGAAGVEAAGFPKNAEEAEGSTGSASAEFS